MKLHESSEKITNAAFKKKSYTIKESPKAFLILSSSLYSDKPKAIIRELSTNALDSHIEGNVQRPFDVILPTPEIPTLTIRDYGKGLSPEQIETVYTVYFESTKETSNDYVGALGLGSKSPFSYTNSFNVTSYQPEFINTYFVCIDGGEPCVYTISENVIPNKTGETGLEVSIEIDVSDVSRFTVAASKVFTFFDKHSVSITTQAGTKIDKPHWSIEKSRLTISYDSEYMVNAFYAKMGSVAYEIDTNLVDMGLVGSLSYYGYVFEFEMGELEFQPSREALSYNQQTLDAIKKKVAETSKEIATRLQKNVDGSMNLREALTRVQRVLVGNKATLYEFLKFKGRTLSEHLSEYEKSLSTISHKHREFIKEYNASKKLAYPRTSPFSVTRISPLYDCMFIIKTTNIPMQRTLQAFQEEYSSQIYIVDKHQHALIGHLKKFNERIIFSHSDEFKETLKKFTAKTKTKTVDRKTKIHTITIDMDATSYHPNKTTVKERTILASEIKNLKNVLDCSISGGSEIAISLDSGYYSCMNRSQGYVPYSVRGLVDCARKLGINTINLVYYAKDKPVINKDALLEKTFKEYLDSKYGKDSLLTNLYEIDRAKIYNQLGLSSYSIPDTKNDTELLRIVYGTYKSGLEEVYSLPIMNTTIGRMLKVYVDSLDGKLLTEDEVLKIKALLATEE